MTFIEKYEYLKNYTPNREKALAYVAAFDFESWSNTLREFIGEGAEDMIALEAQEHKYDVERHKERLEIIISRWDEILEVINELPSEEQFIAILDSINAPKTVEELGIDRDTVDTTFAVTKDIRDKYVLSRLFWDLGIL